MKYVIAPDNSIIYLAVLDPLTGKIGLLEAGLFDTAPTQGPKGSPGIQGEVGPRGLPGVNNLITLHGDGPPRDTEPVTVGIDGQLYIDDLTGNLYERLNGKWL